MATSAVFRRASYPPKNAFIWQDCERIWASEIVLLGQANNLSTAKMADLRHALRQQSVFLKFPKPGILRAYLGQSQWSGLQPGVIGSTFCVVSKADNPAFQMSLQKLQGERNIVLLGGKILDLQLTIEAINEFVTEIPSITALQSQLVSLLQSPALGVTSKLEASQQTMVGYLETYAQSQATKPDKV